MTDFSSSPEDDYVVRVNAQVMTRDDSAGGWNPIKGGIAVVGLRKQLVVTQEADDPQHEYLIHGQRIKDQSEVLSCILTKDVDYTKATPTFIHWQMEGKRFGLTFSSSADAKAFDKGMTKAVDDILDVTRDLHDANANIHAGDGEVFMTLDLPLGRNGSSSLSASTTSTTTSSPQSPALPNINETFYIQNGSSNNNMFPHPHANQHYQHRIHYISSDRIPVKSPSQGSSDHKTSSTKSNQSIIMSDHEIWIKEQNGSLSEDFGDSAYVEFNTAPKVNDYSYPNLENIRGPPPPPALSSQQQPPPPTHHHHQPQQHRSTQRSPQRRDSISSMKRHMQSNRESPNNPALPLKHIKTSLFSKRRDKRQSKHLLDRAQCCYCKEAFSRKHNPRGSCEDAPDAARNCIEHVSCLCSARGMLFHCLADEEHNYDANPCLCDTSDENNSTKWTMLTVLSIFVPCLWCYRPLMACHSCGVSRGCCGGRHRAS